MYILNVTRPSLTLGLQLNEFWKSTWDFTGIIGEREG